jgi:predicted ester cyclase
VRDFYLRYLAACNDHDFGALSAFVAPDVVVNGAPQGLDGYVAGLRAVVEEFPDYRWEPVHLLFDGDVIAAHFTDTGTQASSGQAVRRQEFAFYRVVEGLIAEVWVTADDLAAGEQSPGPAVSDPAASDPAASDPAASDPAVSGSAVWGPPRSGPEMIGPERSGTERSGSERSGSERSGPGNRRDRGGPHR